MKKLWLPHNSFHQMGCRVTSFPLNQTRLEIGFKNCSGDSCKSTSGHVTLLSAENGDTLIKDSLAFFVKFERRQQMSSFVMDVVFEMFAGADSGILTW